MELSQNFTIPPPLLDKSIQDTQTLGKLDRRSFEESSGDLAFSAADEAPPFQVGQVRLLGVFALGSLYGLKPRHRRAAIENQKRFAMLYLVEDPMQVVSRFGHTGALHEAILAFKLDRHVRIGTHSSAATERKAPRSSPPGAGLAGGGGIVAPGIS